MQVKVNYRKRKVIYFFEMAKWPKSIISTDNPGELD